MTGAARRAERVCIVHPMKGEKTGVDVVSSVSRKRRLLPIEYYFLFYLF